MAQFTKADRQRIIDSYLSETGRNMFVPGEFIDWLADNEDHEAYEWFFAKDDASAAREYRIGLARQMASGLRIVVEVSTAPAAGSVVQITVREFPAFVSPVASRKSGGGYEPFDPNDPAAMAEFRRQGAVALGSWLARYGGAFADMDLTIIKEIASQADRVALSA